MLLSFGWLMMGNENSLGPGNFSEVEENKISELAWLSPTKQCGVFKLLQAYLHV